MTLEANRTPIELLVIYRTNYEDSLSYDAFLQAWTDIAECLKLRPGFLRTTDVFGVDIGAGAVTTDELDELADRAVAYARDRGRTVDLEALKTVDDYVREIGTLLMSAPRN